MLFPLLVEAQISFGGTPPSFFSTTKSSSVRKIPQKTISIDKKEISLLKKQDSVAKKNELPPIVAKLTPTNIDLVADGQWARINGDSVCRLIIASPDAEGIIFYYDKFNIPEGGKLYIYNQDKSQLLGAYTNKTNKKGGKFSTEIVYGDTLTLEYVQPEGQSKPKIVISNLGYCYNLAETMGTDGLLRSTKSNDCYVDINCSEGDNWQQQKKGVAKTITKIGIYSYLCSGSLVNNVYQDKTPYFLTAHHCFYENADTADFSTIQFYFHYESTSCGNNSTVSSKMKTMIGANLLVDTPLFGGSDGALLRLRDSIPESYDVYYNGWDISTAAPTSGVVIQHPNGGLKKIATYTETPTTTTFTDADGNAMTDAHWKVVYRETTNGFSVTAGGSSGSPMFNQDGRIVGTLTGGESYCETPTAPDYYGKFSYHWNKATDKSEWMSTYLNPSNYLISAINGIDGHTAGDTIVGENYLTITPVIFGNYLSVTTSYVLKEIRVYSVSGRLMALSSTSPINTRSWPSGVYIIMVTTSGGEGKAKVVK